MDLIGSLPHASQAEMPRRRWQTRVKTTSIVFDFQGDALFGVGQKAMHAGSFAMAKGVVDAFPRDHAEIVDDPGGQGRNRREGLDPELHYTVLAQRHGAPRLRTPFNREARLAAGFSAAEIAALGG